VLQIHKSALVGISVDLLTGTFNSGTQIEKEGSFKYAEMIGSFFVFCFFFAWQVSVVQSFAPNDSIICILLFSDS